MPFLLHPISCFLVLDGLSLLVDHLWMTSNESFPERPSQIANQSIEEWDVGACSFSTSFMSRNQDISFGAGSPVICDTQSTAFTCISSLSSSSGFSFHSSGDLNDLESSSLVSSMPSFAFFRPASLVEHGNCKLEVSANLTSIEATNEGNSNLTLSNSVLIVYIYVISHPQFCFM